jgi:hypothetical protein
LPGGQCGAVAVIQRASSDLRCNPHVHAIFLDGLYAQDVDGKGQMFHPASGPSQQDIDQVVKRTSKRILRFLQRRGVITLVTAPGEGTREARGVGRWRCRSRSPRRGRWRSDRCGRRNHGGERSVARPATGRGDGRRPCPFGT